VCYTQTHSGSVYLLSVYVYFNLHLRLRLSPVNPLFIPMCNSPCHASLFLEECDFSLPFCAKVLSIFLLFSFLMTEGRHMKSPCSLHVSLYVSSNQYLKTSGHFYEFWYENLVTETPKHEVCNFSQLVIIIVIIIKK
jgi:hypothetical protein